MEALRPQFPDSERLSMFCWRCGSAVYLGQNFCNGCGAPISATAPVAIPRISMTVGRQQIIVRRYIGSQSGAMQTYQQDSIRMAAVGYFPTSQVWAPGEYGCGSFVLALLLCVILVGILIFIYMLIVKPNGTLTVTYELRSPQYR